MIPSDWESEADIGPCPTYRHMDDVSTPHHSFCDTLLFCYVDTNLFYYCSIMTKKCVNTTPCTRKWRFWTFISSVWVLTLDTHLVISNEKKNYSLYCLYKVNVIWVLLVQSAYEGAACISQSDVPSSFNIIHVHVLSKKFCWN